MSTAHERHEAQVKTYTPKPWNDGFVAENLRSQIAGLAAERDALLARLAGADGAIEDALRQQIAGLRTERDMLREQVESIGTKLEQARQTADMWRRAYHGDGVAPE
jgi:uncharacterized coiled-coil DUF342 family protein